MFILVLFLSLRSEAAITSTVPSGLVSQKEGSYFIIVLVPCVFSLSALLGVLCRYSVVGGVSGSRTPERVFVPHLFYSSDVLSTAVCSGGENVRSRGRDPLCRPGKRTPVFQRSDVCVQ